MRKSLLLAAFAALFVVCTPARAQFCPGVSPWVFDDVAASDPFCGYITWMAENGITLGCQTIDPNHRLYCPNATVTRAAMAAFMNRLGNIRVEAVDTGPGLTGGPITSVGTINLATTQLLPTTACVSGQMPVWNGTAWACGSPSGGTVTSVATGAGLTGGPITGSGVISADTNFLQRRVSGNCAVGSAITAIAADGTVTCAPVGTGTVTSVATGTGLTGGPITGSGTVSIANGGVGTTQLADASVTKPKLSAIGGGNGQVLTTDGTSLLWQTMPQIVTWQGFVANQPANQAAFVFAGPTVAITIPAGATRRVTATGTAAIGASSAGTGFVAMNLCYNVSGGPVTEFSPATYTYAALTTTLTTHTVAYATQLSAGTYNVGFCLQNGTTVPMNSNDYSTGWVMVTPI